MNNFFKNLSPFALILCLFFVFATAGLAEIKVGVISSQTSSLAILGQRQINAAILAAEEWNEKGGINGTMIRLIIEDSADRTTTAVTAL
ncbi:MAG: ABC transporter substrate-binding protein, partial [Desulfobacterales bacterium]